MTPAAATGRLVGPAHSALTWSGLVTGAARAVQPQRVPGAPGCLTSPADPAPAPAPPRPAVSAPASTPRRSGLQAVHPAAASLPPTLPGTGRVGFTATSAAPARQRSGRAGMSTRPQ